MKKGRQQSFEDEQENQYQSLRLDVLEKLINLRSLPYKTYKKDIDTKNHIINILLQDDDGKFIFETTYEKFDGGYIIGIDIRNHKDLMEITKLIEKKLARNLNRYCDNRLQYWSSEKLKS